MKTRLYISACVVLGTGLCAAALIYLTAEDDPGGAALLEMQISKPYVRELMRFGGKAAVLFDEFSRWFAGLWRGRALAITIAWISIFVSAGVFLFAHFLPADAGSDSRGEDERNRSVD